MLSFLTLIIQKYWTIWLPILHKYWKVSIPLIFCFILLHYLITLPVGSESFWLSVGSIICFGAFSIIEFFFSKRKSINLINAYSEKPTVQEGVKPVPSLLKNTLQFSIPKKIKLNQTGQISIKIDSVRSVVRLAKSAKNIKSIRTDNFRLGISSDDLEVSPSEPINLSELGEEFPINFTWKIKGESLGVKLIKINPGAEFSKYLGLSSKRSSSWVESIEVVEQLGWTAKQIKFLKQALLTLGVAFSLPIMLPAFNLIINEVGEKEPVVEIEGLEALVLAEFAVLEEIKNDERTYLDDEEIQWHIENLESYRKIKDAIEQKERPNSNYKLFWLRAKQYEYQIFQKFRKSYAKSLSDRHPDVYCQLNEGNRHLFCYSTSFGDSLKVESFLSGKKELLKKFDILSLCLKESINEAGNICKGEIMKIE